MPPILKEGEPGSPEPERKPNWTWELGSSPNSAKKLDFFHEPTATVLGDLYFAPQPSIAEGGRLQQTGNVVLLTAEGLFWGGGVLAEGKLNDANGFFFKYPAAAGDSYDMKTYLDALDVSKRIEESAIPVKVTAETLAVAAGTFKCLVYNIQWGIGLDDARRDFVSKFYVAPGVGLVKIQDYDRPGKSMEMLPVGTARRVASQPSSPEFREFLRQMRAKAPGRKERMP